jgi:hypothetical protein
MLHLSFGTARPSEEPTFRFVLCRRFVEQKLLTLAEYMSSDLYRNCLRWRNTWVQICTETAYVGGTHEFRFVQKLLTLTEHMSSDLYRNCWRWRNTWVQICTETADVGGAPEFWLNYSFFVLTIFCSLCLSALRHQYFIRIGDKNKQCRYSIQGYYFYRHTRGLFVGNRIIRFIENYDNIISQQFV